MPILDTFEIFQISSKDKSENTFINYVVCQGCAKLQIALTDTKIRKESNKGCGVLRKRFSLTCRMPYMQNDIVNNREDTVA